MNTRIVALLPLLFAHSMSGQSITFLRYDGSTSTQVAEAVSSILFHQDGLQASLFDAPPINGIRAIGIEELTTSVHEASVPPVLLTVFPNPTNASVDIMLRVDKTASVRIAVLDAMGKWVANVHEGQLPPGLYRFPWSPGDHALAEGVYGVRVMSGTNVHWANILYHH